MSNPNIAMLENVISAAVSTQYKEVPPTEEEFINLAQTMRSNMSAFAVTDDEFADILVRLRASIVIQMDVGVFINDRNMSRIRSTNSKPEEIVRKYLFSKGFRYRKNVKKLPGCPDIVLPKYKTVIFVNGCFWHKHDCPRFVWPSSNQDYWIPKIQRNIERDRLNAAELQKKGWHIITVWECELKKKNRELRLERLLSEITREDFDNGTNQP